MKKLYFLNDEILGLLELQDDMLFHKIPKNKIKYYINEASNIGKREAEKYRGKNLDDILQYNGVETIIRDTSKSKRLDLRGEIIFDKKEKIIIIYKDSMEQLYNCLKEAGIVISKNMVYDIHLAHEFYHFIEYKNNKNTNELLDKIETISIGVIKKKSSIIKTREVAAHSFCKEVLGLKFHPKLMDYIYLIQNNRLDEKELRKYVDDSLKKIV